MSVKEFFKNAFSDMKENAKAQHEVDKANFAAAKAESKANFEENRGTVTMQRAKEKAKQSWDDAHMTPAQHTAKMREQQCDEIAYAKMRKADAEARTEQAKAERAELLAAKEAKKAAKQAEKQEQNEQLVLQKAIEDIGETVKK